MFSRKRKTLAELAAIAAREKKRGRRVVLANGCFDLFHVGHVRYLEAAKARGDVLVVALNSDSSVRALKGPGRPLLAAEERAEILSAFACVDYVTIFKERDVGRILRRLRPNVHAKGSDYTAATVPERRVVLGYGGEIFIAGGPKVRSTSDLLRRIARRGTP
ncbi:MAG: adenylyltransferase/cytidyltransferase family protein [Candidatus Aminicenantes bacterium]|nr:adenylyltransferase/cytidyltransferase family protein [Candidatus Aminicenantes bacterium]